MTNLFIKSHYYGKNNLRVSYLPDTPDRQMKDKRYGAILPMIKAGKINAIEDIFLLITKTKVSEDSGINYSTLKRKIGKVTLFTYGEMRMLASLFEVDVKELVDIFENELNSASAKKAPKKKDI